MYVCSVFVFLILLIQQLHSVSGKSIWFFFSFLEEEKKKIFSTFKVKLQQIYSLFYMYVILFYFFFQTLSNFVLKHFFCLIWNHFFVFEIFLNFCSNNWKHHYICLSISFLNCCCFCWNFYFFVCLFVKESSNLLSQSLFLYIYFLILYIYFF